MTDMDGQKLCTMGQYFLNNKEKHKDEAEN